MNTSNLRSLTALNDRLCVLQPPAHAYRFVSGWRPVALVGTPSPPAERAPRVPNSGAVGGPVGRRKLWPRLLMAGVLGGLLAVVNLAYWGLVRVNHQRTTYRLAHQLRQTEVQNRNLVLANRALNAYVVMNEPRMGRPAEVMPAAFVRVKPNRPTRL